MPDDNRHTCDPGPTGPEGPPGSPVIAVEGPPPWWRTEASPEATAAELAWFGHVETYVRNLPWSPGTPEDTKTIVGGNVLGFAAWLITHPFPDTSKPRPEPARVMSGAPRRSVAAHWCQAEHAIQAAVDDVEAMPPHPWLTEAVVLLGQARHRVADFVELSWGKEQP